MTPACTRCVHGKIAYIQGRERVGCLRPRLLPDGAVLHAPRDGYEAVVERLPQSDLEWRAPGDKCSTEAKHFKEAT